jgi:hypothetical protein
MMLSGGEMFVVAGRGWMGECRTLVEQCGDWRADACVEQETRFVRNVALAGRESRNGYVYSESALREAVSLYDRKPVFLDHAPDRGKPQERSTRDLVGSIVNARYEGGRIRGDIRVLETESGQTFLSLVQSDTPGVGMSHVVLAERGADGLTVERIRDVISVDAVVGPATTRTFRESAEEVGTTRRDEHGELLGEISALRARRDELAAEVARLTAGAEQGGSRAVRQVLQESGLPEFACGSAFEGQLLGADQEQRRALIEERRELLRRAMELGPRSAERGHVRDADERTAFVGAIRRR